METSQGNSLCSYLKQTKSFFFFKIGEQEGKTGPVCGVDTIGKRKGIRKGCRRFNVVEISYTHV
jgi:hypothetical protein